MTRPFTLWCMGFAVAAAAGTTVEARAAVEASHAIGASSAIEAAHSAGPTPLSVACVPRSEQTRITQLAENGYRISVSTGTDGGTCIADGVLITCRDGENFAEADMTRGCVSFGGAGWCVMSNGPREVLDEAEENGTGSSMDASRTDILCGTGRLRGHTFTLSGGDDTGVCGPNHDVRGDVNGGTCSRNGDECASVSCDTGCGRASRGCQCTAKSGTTRLSPESGGPGVDTP